MSEQTPSAEEPDRYARARTDEEPGAHSGGESQARERVLPGTASAAGGYPSQNGTAQGDPLAGVEKSAQAAQGGEGPGPVTREHVRELLEARDDGPTLVVVEGRAQVVPADDLGSGRYAGALEVVSGEELTRQVPPGARSERELDALAATLNTMVSKLGA
ncbi:hypothetical protein [Streptomyces sp. SLBN-31]|jgi:hypothetical protein|uniref:hypothetical protein n=1 Tax=Streptomyces sp. SLBN-31 TaxID=2768444 RepID=UPI0011668D4E|nr:hypothetical protein [Streptomyces sp. SLBN-31]TQJ90919.1 hypothetical protein FBY22_1715 [Streptomyces sp. SLBN-31]